MSPLNIVDRLKWHGIDPNNVLNFNGDLLENDKYHLFGKEGVWQVYYSERGHKWDHREFRSEGDGCVYLWNLLKKDESIWR